MTEPLRDSLAQRLDLPRGAAEAIALIDQEPFELIDVFPYNGDALRTAFQNIGNAITQQTTTTVVNGARITQ